LRRAVRARGRWAAAGLTFLFLIASLFVLAPEPVTQAQTPSSLASEYAPVLHFAAGEKFYPVSVDYLINSSVLMERIGNGASDVLVNANPTQSTLGQGNTSDYFLYNKLNTSAAIAAAYDAKAATIGYYAYVHVVQSPASTVIQYWLFYVYNDGTLNNHQGDLEVVEVFLNSAGTPTTLLLSQHGAGENAAWGDVETSGTHPVVYVAQGSHANYFRPYQGKIGIEDDVVGDNGLTITPSMLNLVMLGSPGNHSADQSWLDFQGRWGYWGTDQQVAAGEAGPQGPVFNQGGIRWAQPEEYLADTLHVNGTYFDIAEIAANFLLIFAAYIVIRGVWKVVGIIRMKRKTGLFVTKFLKGRGGMGVAIGVVGILVTIAALTLPWYSVSASSQSGPLATGGGTTLMTIDGISGLNINLFTGTGDATSGFTTIWTTTVPFAILFVCGLMLLAFDVIGVKSGKKLSGKFIRRAISSFVPLIAIAGFIAELPSFLPFASGLLPGTSIPPGAVALVKAVGSSPFGGSASQTFPVVGVTTVSWGYGIGTYLFVAGAAIMIVAALVLRKGPTMEEAGPTTKVSEPPPVSPEVPQPPTEPSPIALTLADRLSPA